MSTETDKAVQVLAIASAAMKGIEIVADAGRGILANAQTTSAITAVLQGLVGLSDAIQRGLQGTDTPESITASIAELEASLAGNNAAIDADIDSKFPTG
jgi:hypothetical protein